MAILCGISYGISPKNRIYDQPSGYKYAEDEGSDRGTEEEKQKSATEQDDGKLWRPIIMHKIPHKSCYQRRYNQPPHRGAKYQQTLPK
jgi:hypothetical protein